MGFGQNLRRIRKEKRLSQDDLANKLQCSRATIARWERGTLFPSGYTQGKELRVETLAKALGCSVGELFAENIGGVFIQGMKRPDNCRNCPFLKMMGYSLRENRAKFVCPITNEELTQIEVGRGENCLLEEI